MLSAAMDFKGDSYVTICVLSFSSTIFVVNGRKTGTGYSLGANFGPALPCWAAFLWMPSNFNSQSLSFFICKRGINNNCPLNLTKIR